MREWIADFSESDTPYVYLIRRDFDGICRGWQRADFSGVLDLLGDAAYGSAIDEDFDTLTVFVLTDVGMLPIAVTQAAEGDFVEVTLSYREPGRRGRPKMIEADKGSRRRVEV